MSDWSSLTETLQTPPPPYTSTFTRLSTATSQQVLEEPRRHSDVTKTDVTSHSAADKQLHHTTQSAAFTDHVTVSTVLITTVNQNSHTHYSLALSNTAPLLTAAKSPTTEGWPG